MLIKSKSGRPAYDAIADEDKAGQFRRLWIPNIRSPEMRALTFLRRSLAAAMLLAPFAPTTATAASCSLSAFTLPISMEGSRAAVPVEVNGQPTRFWLDSGAWFSTMSEAKAAELGLHPDPAPEGLVMTGVGGTFTPRVVKIKDLSVNGSMIHNIDFVVGGSDPGNGLIGRSLIANNDIEFDLPHGVVKLVRASDCGNANMAYWAGSNPYFVAKLRPDRSDTAIHDLDVTILINGHEVLATMDTGATTVLTRSAAEAAGISLTAPNAVPIDAVGGLGKHFTKAWRARVDSVEIGNEKILHTTLTVIDGAIAPEASAPRMLLGIDFMLAHHVYVSRSQHLIFFTYSGGPVFAKDAVDAKLSAPRSSAPLPSDSTRVTALEEHGDPKDAAGFFGRGSARLAKGENDGAMQDFNRAISLDPHNSTYYLRRADLLAQSGKSGAARADLDQAISIAPADPAPVLARGWLRHLEGEDVGAISDAETARTLTPKQSLQGVLIAALFNDLGKPREAISIYTELIASHPDDNQLGALLNGRCWSRALAAIELDAALADCNRALKLSGNSAVILDSRALVEFRQRNYRAALSDYDAAITERPDAKWTRFMHGRTLVEIGQAEKGKAESEAAILSDKGVADRARRYNLN